MDLSPGLIGLYWAAAAFAAAALICRAAHAIKATAAAIATAGCPCCDDQP